MIKNPPKDARDTAAWKSFFESNFTDVFVASCTIDLENEPLLKVLVRRKELLHKLFQLLDEHVDGSKLDVSADKDKILELCDEVPKWKKFLCCCAGQSAETIINAIQKLDSKIEELSSHKYDVGTVFVTFETEAAQHHVLDTLINKKGDLDERFHFQGQVLKVKKPVEPSAVRWQDLNDSLIVRRIMLAIYIRHLVSLTFFSFFHMFNLILYVGKIHWNPYNNVDSICFDLGRRLGHSLG